MISFLTGTIKAKTANSFLVLTSGGVGYEVAAQSSFLSKKNTDEKIDLFTYLKVSENSLDLFGFETKEELDFFELLISVSGVGPKSGLHILSLGSIDEIKQAIVKQDVSYLTRVSGIGKKTAERMVVELKNKIGKLVGVGDGDIESEALADVVDGLVSLGYSKVEARDAAKMVKNKSKNSEDLLREALKMLSK